MLGSVRRSVVLVLLVVCSLGVLRPGPAAADAPRPITISGTLVTPDGAPLTAPVQVTLYSWFPAGDAAYPTPQRSVFVGPGSDLDYSLTVDAPGYWAVRARPLSSQAAYLTTWFGSGEAIATGYGQPGVIQIGEDAASRSGADIVLRQGVTVGGTVRGNDGRPLADVTVSARRWNSDGALEAVPGLPGAITDPVTGRWSMTVAAGTPLSLAVTGRTGYRSWVLGEQTTTRTADNTLVATQGATQDVTLTPDWSDTGPGSAIARQESCLQHALPGTADVGGLPLEVSSYGWIAPAGTDLDHVDPLAAGSSTPALAPYWSDVARSVTWGVAGDTLCVTWRAGVDGTAYQALVGRDGAVTFNYGTLGPNLYRATPVAGWTDGTGAGHERVLLPGPYDDATATALVRGSRGSDVAGRYRFRFAGFADTDPTTAPVATTTPAITPAAPVAGDVLSADTGAWTVPGGDPSDLSFGFQWFRGDDPVAGAIRPTLATAPSDPPGTYTVRVSVRRTGSAPVFARRSVTLTGTAPTADRPSILGAPSVGRTVRVPSVSWTGGADTTSYQWKRNGISVPGATGRTYVVRERDRGQALTVRVFAAREGYLTGRVLSRGVRVGR